MSITHLFPAKQQQIAPPDTAQPVGVPTYAGVREFLTPLKSPQLQPAPRGRKFYVVEPQERIVPRLLERPHVWRPPVINQADVQQMIRACRAADQDIERLGALTGVTIDLIRDCLRRLDQQ